MAKRILLIEDNDDDREIFCRALDHAGYDIIEAEDGSDGLVKAFELIPHAVIVDIVLPGMGGWEVATVIKGSRRLTDTKVIILTGTGTVADRNHADSLGLDAYLMKPIEPGSVVREVRRLIGDPE